MAKKSFPSLISPMPTKCQECRQPECFKLASVAELIATFNESRLQGEASILNELKDFLNYKGVLVDEAGAPACQVSTNCF